MCSCFPSTMFNPQSACEQSFMEAKIIFCTFFSPVMVIAIPFLALKALFSSCTLTNIRYYMKENHKVTRNIDANEYLKQDAKFDANDIHNLIHKYNSIIKRNKEIDLHNTKQNIKYCAMCIIPIIGFILGCVTFKSGGEKDYTWKPLYHRHIKPLLNQKGIQIDDFDIDYLQTTLTLNGDATSIKVVYGLV